VKIELTDVRVGHGEESPLFDAMLRIDGRPVASVHNNGRGGCDRWFWRAAADAKRYRSWAQAWCKRHKWPALPGEEGDGPVHAHLPADGCVAENIEIK